MVNDIFGVLKKYETSSENQQEFYLPMSINDLSENILSQIGLQVDLFSFRENEEDDEILYYELSDYGDDPFFFIFPDSSDIQLLADCNANHESFQEQGHQFSEFEWRNVEFTGFFFIEDVSNTNGYLEIYARKGFSAPDENNKCCTGHAYGTRIYWARSGSNEGAVEHFKTEWNPSTVTRDKKKQTVLSRFYQKWFGVKLVVRNVVTNNRREVHIETWICASDNPSELGNWTLVNKTIDFAGNNWNSGGLECGATSADSPITWGAPIVGFTFNGANAAQFKFISAREIEPDPNENTEPDNPQDDNCIPSVPQNNIIYQSTSWSNGINRTITGHGEFDPYDNKTFLSAGENRELNIVGDGTAFLSGKRARIYILAANYNASIEVKFIPNSSIDNLSLRMRSRHNENNPTSNRFGGYGCAVHHDEVEFNRENYHNDHEKFGQPSFSPALQNGVEYTVRFSVRDVNNGVRLTFEVDYGSGFELKGERTDTNPEDYMLDRNLYLVKKSVDEYSEPSYFWIRTNADSGTPTDIRLRDVICRNIDAEPGTGPGTCPDPDPDPDPPVDPIPPVDPNPDGTCPIGYHFNSTLNKCIPDDPCPAGFHLNVNNICVPNTPIPPPDIPPPPTFFTLTKRFTLHREIINDSKCQCDGVTVVIDPPDPDPGGGGGGGGASTLEKIYEVKQKGFDGVAKLASVSNNSNFYLKYGQIIVTNNSVFFNRKVVRIEIFIEEEDKPRGGTGEGVRIVIRHRLDHATLPNSIAVDFGYIREKDLHDKGRLYVLEKLDNEYQCEVGDRILVEYDGGDRSDYVKVYWKKNQKTTHSKITYQNNKQDEGEYTEVNNDLCMTVFAKKS